MLWHLLVLSTLALFAGLPPQLECAFMGHTTSRSSGCLHNGTRYADNSIVPTTEKCLSCVCSKKNLACRLKVCPEMPMPPPRGCVVVQKQNTCCSYLSCARHDSFYKIPTASRIIAYLDHYERESIDRVVNENVLQRRSDDSDGDLYVCVKNGTVYKSGSAMSSSNLCSYCYCIGGTEKCVKPKCMLPVEGCKPIFVDAACCPVRYDCTIKASGKSSQELRYRKTSNKHFLRMSQRLQRNRGCMTGKHFYVEGQKMKSDEDKPCDICFCIRGTRRCAPKKCAPALKNCMPVVPKGQCCPSSYDCGSQRDYRRAQNSRQFNLFSLLFGPEEGEVENSSYAAAHYPHDRQPGPSIYKDRPNLSSSSEKSIFDTLREGLEFIDQNNKILEDDTELRNFSRSTVSPSDGAPTSSSEVTLLDLLLGPAEESPSSSTESTAEEKTTTTVGGISWVDFLLGSDENEKKAVAKEVTEKLDLTNTPLEFGTAMTIERIHQEFDEFSGSGEIRVGETWATEQEDVEETTTVEDSTTELGFSSSITPLPEYITFNNLKANATASNITVSKITPKPALQEAEITNTFQQKGNTSLNKTIESNKKPQQNLNKAQAVTFAESEQQHAAKNATVGKPSSGGILSGLVGGISDMLITEKTVHKTGDRILINSTVAKILTTRIPPLTTRSMSPTLPSFTPLPTQKTRINSKIANLTLDPFKRTTSQVLNSTLEVPHMEHKAITATNTAHHLKNITTNSSFSTSVLNTSTVASSSSFSGSIKASNIVTTSNPKVIPLTTTTSSTAKPLYVKTNPTILEAEILDANNDPTLPPSLPNLKIIPFLPTDAVQADRKQTLYEFYHSKSDNGASASSVSSGSTMLPALLVDGHWDTVADKNSKMDYSDSYDEGKMYPSITEPYETYPGFGDASKAEYIYKFNIEGPSSSMSSNEGKLDGSKSSAAFIKYDFGGSGSQISGGFSPPTKTEGGFIPKEPLVIKESVDGAPKIPSLELYQVTPHIIDITMSEPMKESSTKVIEITTPDPFKNVIRTEPPPDLTSLIEDKQNILSAHQMYPMAPNATQANEEKIIVHITTELPEITIAPAQLNASTVSLDDVILKDSSSIETFLDLLFKEDELNLERMAHLTTKKPITTPATTVPPFKSLPHTVMTGYFKDPRVTSEGNSNSGNSFSTTARPSLSKHFTAITNKITSTTTARSKLRPTATTKNPSGWLDKELAEKTRPVSFTSPAILTKNYVKPTTSIPTITAPKMIKATTTKNRPILTAPFDKLPFMDTSFEVRPNAASSTPHRSSDSFLGLVHYKNSLNKIEGLEPAYEVDSLYRPTPGEYKTTADSASLKRISSTTTTSITSVSQSLPPQSASNSLTDPSGILKLAGCNIYGRMYRVGRIILELSSACLECRCTEIGVKCGPLDC